MGCKSLFQFACFGCLVKDSRGLHIVQEDGLVFCIEYNVIVTYQVAAHVILKQRHPYLRVSGMDHVRLHFVVGTCEALPVLTTPVAHAALSGESRDHQKPVPRRNSLHGLGCTGVQGRFGSGFTLQTQWPLPSAERSSKRRPKSLPSFSPSTRNLRQPSSYSLHYFLLGAHLPALGSLVLFLLIARIPFSTSSIQTTTLFNPVVFSFLLPDLLSSLSGRHAPLLCIPESLSWKSLYRTSLRTHSLPELRVFSFESGKFPFVLFA